MNPFSKRYVKKKGSGGTPPVTTAIPIRGGHYVDYVLKGAPIVNHVPQMGIDQWDNGASMGQARTQIRDSMFLRGARHRYVWRQIETSLGVYDWSVVDTHLSNALDMYNTSGKLFMILIGVTAGTQARPDLTPPIEKGQGWLVPDYLLDGPNGATYKNGQWPYEGQSSVLGGWRMRFDNANTCNRFNIFLTAFMDHVKNYAGGAVWPAFEGISFTEGSIGAVANGAGAGWTGFTGGEWTAPTSSAYFDGYFSCLSHLVSILPDKHVFASMNHPIGVKGVGADPGMHLQIPRMVPGRMGFCTPNIVPTDTNLWRAETGGAYKGTLRYFADYKDILPLAPNIQGEDYMWTQIQDGAIPGHVPTIQELYECCRDSLFAHYIIWQRERSDTPIAGQPAGTKNWDMVMQFLNTAGPWKAIDGGLSTVVPSIYTT